MNNFETGQKIAEWAKKYEGFPEPRPAQLRWWQNADGTKVLQQAWTVPGVAWIWLDVPTDDVNSPQ